MKRRLSDEGQEEDQRENNNKAISISSCNIEPLKIPWAPGNIEEVSTSMKAQQPEPEIAARKG